MKEFMFFSQVNKSMFGFDLGGLQGSYREQSWNGVLTFRSTIFIVAVRRSLPNVASVSPQNRYLLCRYGVDARKPVLSF